MDEQIPLIDVDIKPRWNRVHFSSQSVEWATPDGLFQELDKEFHFTLDLAATENNAKCERYFTAADNALLLDWGKNVCWCNPPYSRKIGYWIANAFAASLLGATVVLLVPARVDTFWFHRYCIAGGAEIRAIEGRLKFGKSKNSAPFASLVIIFRPPSK